MTFLSSASISDLQEYQAPVLPYRLIRRFLIAATLLIAVAAAAAGTIAAVAAAWTIAASLATAPQPEDRPVVMPAPTLDLALPTTPRAALANPYGVLSGRWATRLMAGGSVAPRPEASETLADARRTNQATPDFSNIVPIAPAPAIEPRLAPSSREVVPEAAVPASPSRAEDVPLPPRHPLLRPAPERRDEAVARPAPGAAPASPANPVVQDSRNPFQRLFDALRQSSGASASEEPEENTVPPPSGAINLPAPGSHVAVYDIAAHTVYLPNGERLEAHSGLGSMLDDPRFVNAKDRGATPPHVYDLELRRQLFHGVAALRLNPVGEGAMYGRVGLLAHTFMLGPNGQSNGCVSFRNYGRFLQAFQSGEVNRLVVVSRLGDSIPGPARRTRYASN